METGQFYIPIGGMKFYPLEDTTAGGCGLDLVKVAIIGVKLYPLVEVSLMILLFMITV